MPITPVSPDYSASPQIRREDVAEIAAMGFRSIMCNRPDGEAADQPPAAEIRAEAERQGLAFAHVPVVSGAITADDVADFEAALAALPGAGASPTAGPGRAARTSGCWPGAEGIWPNPPIALASRRKAGSERPAMCGEGSDFEATVRRAFARLTREDLPRAAAARGWPVRTPEEFERLLLDHLNEPPSPEGRPASSTWCSRSSSASGCSPAISAASP